LLKFKAQSIKVGTKNTIAKFYIKDTEGVIDLLSELNNRLL
jgi:hypothetical protein